MNVFPLLITKWYRLNKRDLPWRHTSDPYLIWISEIILQQTRVDQGKNYYKKFASNYPKINDLANADEIELLNDWQGLGYYSRARNLHFSAKQIRDNYNGKFPTSYDEIIKLKGVGAYTAAAISSIAFNEKRAVVDGNVYRVLSRVFNIATPIDSTLGIKEFQQLANELIDERNPGEYNQAVMELGALICTPKQPKCDSCPLNHMCEGLQQNTVAQLPVKTKKTKVRDRFLHFFVYENNNQLIIEKREGKDIWQNLFQFPCFESTHQNDKNILSLAEYQWKQSDEIIHILSHQKIHATFHHFDFFPKTMNQNWLIIERENLEQYPIPRLIDRYLEKNTLQL